MWPFNTGDCLIEVMTQTGLTVCMDLLIVYNIYIIIYDIYVYLLFICLITGYYGRKN
jgi:hypothetical protein